MLRILLLAYTISFIGAQNEKKQLVEFINLNNKKVRKVINHVSKRWLRFQKRLENADAIGLFSFIFSV